MRRGRVGEFPSWIGVFTATAQFAARVPRSCGRPRAQHRNRTRERSGERYRSYPRRQGRRTGTSGQLGHRVGGRSHRLLELRLRIHDSHPSELRAGRCHSCSALPIKTHRAAPPRRSSPRFPRRFLASSPTRCVSKRQAVAGSEPDEAGCQLRSGGRMTPAGPRTNAKSGLRRGVLGRVGAACARTHPPRAGLSRGSACGA